MHRVGALVAAEAPGGLRPGTPEQQPGAARRGALPRAAPDLVSVITPTCASRAVFHENLYQCFLWQSHQNVELLVVDDGPGPPSPFLQAVCARDTRVRYLRVAEGTSIGEKRNYAVDRARGAVVAHFDDDDLYGPRYVEIMLAHLRASGAELIKIASWGWYDLRRGVYAWYDGEADGDHGRLYGYGFTYVYVRLAVSAVRFPDQDFGEDYQLVLRAMACGVSVHLVRPEAPTRPDEVHVVHVIHGRNTSSSFATRRLRASALNDVFDGFGRSMLREMEWALEREQERNRPQQPLSSLSQCTSEQVEECNTQTFSVRLLEECMGLQHGFFDNSPAGTPVTVSAVKC